MDSMLLKECHEFLFESALVMVLDLGLDVSNCTSLLRDSNGECPVAFLPGKAVGS